MNTICRLFEEVDNVAGATGYSVGLYETETICDVEFALTELVNIKCTDYNTIEITIKRFDEMVRCIYDCNAIRHIEVVEIVYAEDGCGNLVHISKEEVAFK